MTCISAGGNVLAPPTDSTGSKRDENASIAVGNSSIAQDDSRAGTSASPAKSNTQRNSSSSNEELTSRRSRTPVSFHQTPGSASQDVLAGQLVTIHGHQKPIKPLWKTLQALRAGKSWHQAFERKQASYLFYGTDNVGQIRDEDAILNSFPLVSIYFPMSINKEARHNPAECDNVCNGTPHIDRAPICRFCRARIVPNYREIVS